jgi:hypothetical protein
MPFPHYAFTWLNVLHAVRHSHRGSGTPCPSCHCHRPGQALHSCMGDAVPARLRPFHPHDVVGIIVLLTPRVLEELVQRCLCVRSCLTASCSIIRSAEFVSHNHPPPTHPPFPSQHRLRHRLALISVAIGTLAGECSRPSPSPPSQHWLSHRPWLFSLANTALVAGVGLWGGGHMERDCGYEGGRGH